MRDVVNHNFLSIVVGDNDDSYGVQVFANPNIWCEHSSNKIQLKKSVQEIKDANYSLILDMDAGTLKIYINGQMVQNEKSPNNTFTGLKGAFLPAFSLNGTNLQLSISSGMAMPNVTPGMLFKHGFYAFLFTFILKRHYPSPK